MCNFCSKVKFIYLSNKFEVFTPVDVACMYWLVSCYFCTFNILVYLFTFFIYLFYFQVSKLPNPVYCPNNCGRCYKGLGRKGNLMKHLKNECGVPRKFQCSYCWRRFKLKHHLNNHYLKVHTFNLAVM